MENPTNTAPPRRGRGRPPGSTKEQVKLADPLVITGTLNQPHTIAVPNSGATSGSFIGSGGSGGTETVGLFAPAARAAMRPDMRADVRPEDPRASADARAREILEHLGQIDEGTDEFAIPKEYIPDGWTYEWKRRLTLGKPDPAYDVSLRRTGWEIVPASRHPEMMPEGEDTGAIERKGMVLMQRPQQITDMVTKRDDQRARNQIRAKEAQLSGAPEGQFSRTEDPRTAPKIKKSYEPMAIPDDPK